MVYFKTKDLRPNFFLHAWNFFECKGTLDCSTWMYLVTEKKGKNFRVFDIVKDMYNIDEKYILRNTYLSYGDGLTFENAKDKAALNFFDSHKKLNYINSYNRLKDIFPNVITEYNAYDVIKKLVDNNFVLKPTYHYWTSYDNYEENCCSMHIKSMGLFEVRVKAKTKEEAKNFAAYVYICKFIIKCNDDCLDYLDYKIIPPEKYPYNEVVRMSGYFVYSIYRHSLMFFDDRKNKDNKPRIDNILTEEKLKSGQPLEGFIIDACKVYQYKQLINEPIESNSWIQKNKKFFKPMDKITEFGLSQDFPYVERTFVEEMAKSIDLNGMTIDETLQYFRKKVEIEKAKIRKSILSDDINPYLDLYIENNNGDIISVYSLDTNFN